MAMRKTEDNHHTPEQISGYLDTAFSICDAHKLSAAERVALLPMLVQLVSSKQVFYEQVGALPDLSIPRNARR